MAYFSDQALTDLQAELLDIRKKQENLQKRYLLRKFRDDRAKEFAHNGFIRRLSTLTRCTEHVFELIPPDRTKPFDVTNPVDRNIRDDAAINIQASIFNVFGAVDNLAWIWVREKKIQQKNGADLPNKLVGLRRTNKDVRRSLPQDLLDYVKELDDWFDAIDNYRHALAHRIPLYIPPFVVIQEDEARYRELHDRKIQALYVDRDLDVYSKIEEELENLRKFSPRIQHSFGENACPICFHPQLIVNFKTVEGLGQQILNALDH